MSHELIHYITDLIEHLYMRVTYISDPKREYMYKKSKLHYTRHVIACVHICKSLKFPRHDFFCMSKIDMNLSRQVVFYTPRRPTNVLE